MFTDRALRSSLVETCPCVADRIGIWKSWFLRRGENWSTWRKTSWGKGENQQQTQPKYGIDAMIPTRATLVGMRALNTAQPFLPEYSHEYRCYTILSLVTTYMLCYSKSYDFYAWFPYLVVFRWLWMLTSILFHHSSLFLEIYMQPQWMLFCLVDGNCK